MAGKCLIRLCLNRAGVEATPQSETFAPRDRTAAATALAMTGPVGRVSLASRMSLESTKPAKLEAKRASSTRERSLLSTPLMPLTEAIMCRRSLRPGCGVVRLCEEQDQRQQEAVGPPHIRSQSNV